jgi:hypothetical protein
MEQAPFIEAWVCDPPPRGQGKQYRVLRQEWIEQDEKTIRLIYEIEVVEPETA